MTSPIAVGTSASRLVDMPAPDSCPVTLSDVSSSDSGRVEDANATMYKMRVAVKRKVALTWKNRSAEDIATILTAFAPEYFHMRYLDPQSNAYEVREFYVGDRAVTPRSITIGGVTYEVLSFNVIER